MAPVSFGIATAPQQVDYATFVRVWREADAVPEIVHAWLFDHLMPIASNPLGPIFEAGRCYRGRSADQPPAFGLAGHPAG
jgi:hypothetical protein